MYGAYSFRCSSLQIYNGFCQFKPHLQLEVLKTINVSAQLEDSLQDNISSTPFLHSILSSIGNYSVELKLNCKHLQVGLSENMADSWSLVGGQGSGPDGKGGVGQVLAVHAALLPIGRSGSIVYYAGDQWVEPTQWEAIENETNPATDPRYPTAMEEISHSRMFDCATNVVTNPLTPPDDLFCSGHSLLPDGSLAVVGGTQHFPDPADSPDLHHAHWSTDSLLQIYEFD